MLITFSVKNDWAATDLSRSEANSLLERREQQLPSSKLYFRVSSDLSEKRNVSITGSTESDAVNMLLKKFAAIIPVVTENVCTVQREIL